jgi:Protein of unknown function (DUF1640)
VRKTCKHVDPLATLRSLIWTPFIPMLSRSASNALRSVARNSVSPSWENAPFHTTPARHEFHFDTHHFVQRLEKEGLNRAQAEGIMTAMAEVIDESIRNMTSNMVTKGEQDKVCVSTSCFFVNRELRVYT